MKDIRETLKPSRDTWFKWAMRLFDRPTVDEAVWEELEELLISADVGFSTTEKLLEQVRQIAKEEKLSQGSAVRDALQQAMVDMLTIEVPLLAVPLSLPEVSLAVGVNGSGKTTSIAKLAYKAKKEGKRVLLVAADTFRAAAIDQLKKLG